MNIGRAVILFFLLSCGGDEIFDEIIPGFVPLVASPQIEPLVPIAIEMVPASAVIVDQFGQMYAGAEAEFPIPTPIGTTNRAVLTREIPAGYRHLEFRSFSLAIRPPQPRPGVDFRMASLFLIFLGFGPDESQWGQVVFSVIARTFSEPENMIIPGFTIDLNGATFITLMFHEICLEHGPDNPTNMEIQFTGQLR